MGRLVGNRSLSVVMPADDGSYLSRLANIRLVSEDLLVSMDVEIKREEASFRIFFPSLFSTKIPHVVQALPLEPRSRWWIGKNENLQT